MLKRAVFLIVVAASTIVHFAAAEPPPDRFVGVMSQNGIAVGDRRAVSFLERLLNTIPHDTIQFVVEEPRTLDSRITPRILELLEERGTTWGVFTRAVHGPGYGGEYAQRYKPEWGDALWMLDARGNPLSTVPQYWWTVYPSEQRAGYLAEIGTLAAERGAEFFFIEEPEWVPSSGWNPRLIARFEQETGRVWEWERDMRIPAADRYAIERLKEQIMIEMLAEAARQAKVQNPDLTVVVPAHDINHYQVGQLTTSYPQFFTTPEIDAIQSQTWHPSMVYSNEAVASYLGLAYWRFNAKLNPELDVWFLSDPIADFADPGLAGSYRRAFRATVDTAMQLGYSAFSIPWPERIFSSLEGWESAAYWPEIQAIFRVFRSDSDFAHSSLTSAFPVAMLYSTSANYTNYTARASSPVKPLGMAHVVAEWMVKNGVSFQVLESDLLETGKLLEDVELLIVEGWSGGFLPDRADADALAEWVKAGGTLIWINQDGMLAGLPLWATGSEAETPLGYLLRELDLMLPEAVPDEGAMMQTGRGRVIYAPTLRHHEDVFMNGLDQVGLSDGDALATIRELGPQKWTLGRRVGAPVDDPLALTYVYDADETFTVTTDSAMILGGALEGNTLSLRITRWGRNWNFGQEEGQPDRAALAVTLPRPASEVCLDGEPLDSLARETAFELELSLEGEHLLTITLE